MAGAECNDFLTPSAQTVKTRTRSPCTNTEQESTQTLGCSAAELHGRQRRIWGEATAEKTASPIVSSRTEFRDKWEFGASTELRGPETCRAQGAAPTCGWAKGAGLPQPRDPLTTRSQGLWPHKVQLGTARHCSDLAALILPTATLKQYLQADGTIRWWATLSWRWTSSSCYRQLWYLSPYTHLQKPYSKEQS